MIVDTPPYDLVALLACADQLRLLEALVERGQQSGCLRPFRWRLIRDPRRDQVCQVPEQLLEPFLGSGSCRFLIAWDHSGSGREGQAAEMVEREVRERLKRRGVPSEEVAALAFDPELEICFRPVWRRMVDVLAEVREKEAPDDAVILAALTRSGHRAADLDDAFCRFPKELVEAVFEVLSLRRSPMLYATLGQKLSISLLTLGTLGRFSAPLEGWFHPVRSSGDGVRDE